MIILDWPSTMRIAQVRFNVENFSRSAVGPYTGQAQVTHVGAPRLSGTLSVIPDQGADRTEEAHFLARLGQPGAAFRIPMSRAQGVRWADLTGVFQEGDTITMDADGTTAISRPAAATALRAANTAIPGWTSLAVIAATFGYVDADDTATQTSQVDAGRVRRLLVGASKTGAMLVNPHAEEVFRPYWPIQQDLLVAINGASPPAILGEEVLTAAFPLEFIEVLGKV